MNIMVLCLSEGRGGLELYALREMRYFLEQGHTCVPVIARQSQLFDSIEVDGLKPTRLQAANRRVPLLNARKLARLIEQHNIDILHIHWAKDLNLAVLAKRFSRRKIKLVYSRHMGITRSKRDLLHAWFYRHVDKFLTITDLVRKEALDYLPVKPAVIERLYIGVPEPVMESSRCNQFFREPDFPKRHFNIALFGRIEHGKGQHVLIQAMEILVKQKKLDISATIVGHVMDKKYQQELQDRVTEAGLSPHVQFFGFVERPVDIMSCFDTVVLTTYNETFGLVLPEAMRAGVAVVGTNAGGVPEIIKHDRTGMLYEPGNAVELADCLQKLFESPTLRETMARAGQAYADEMFSERQHYAKLEQIFSDLLNETSESPL